jgi:hypothetical protein
MAKLKEIYMHEEPGGINIIRAGAEPAPAV